MIDSETLTHELMNFIGTEHYYAHPNNVEMQFTDGVFHFLDRTKALWLLDAVMLEPLICTRMLHQGITFLTLAVDENHAAKLTAYDDLGCPDYFTRITHLPHCPPGQWKFFFQDGVLMVPSEY